MNGKNWQAVLRYTWFLHRRFGLTWREAYECAEDEYE